MTFAQLTQETFDRGSDYLSNDTATKARVQRWINDAYLDICERQPWPFLQTTVTTTAPYTFTDLREILSVTNTTSIWPITVVERQTLASWWADLTMTGVGIYAYMEGDTLNLYPVDSSSTLSIRYAKVPVELSADADVPVIPSRFQNVIVDGAMALVHKDDDNWDLASDNAQAFEQGIQSMTFSLMARNAANPDAIDVLYSGNY